jgi:aromatic-L-amino-acid/L-tryptophan decarboxylase
MTMDLTAQQRDQLWKYLVAGMEQYYSNTKALKVSPELDKIAVEQFVMKYNDQEKVAPEEALRHIFEGLTRYAVHTPHPGYFGLFNPRSNFAGIMADMLTAVFNPQLAAWSHAPFASETENYMIREMGRQFGYNENEIDGNFTSGGQEANLTAFLCAINHRFPQYASEGLLGIQAKPVIYCSAESHHSVVKAASIMGLGIKAVRSIGTTGALTIDTNKLEAQIQQDTKEGFTPLLIVSTMGATGTGIIDPIEEIRTIATKHACWLHADAAYGGAVILSAKHKYLLHGIEKADSITFDAHKWLSVPMGAGMFITRHPDILNQTFRVIADYMPKEGSDLGITDGFSHSIQWSRRFIGLKLYLSLLIYGWSGFNDLINQQIEKGNYLRNKLIAAGWELCNDTTLPIICFGKAAFKGDDSLATNIAQRVIASGKAWLSVYKISTTNTIRACMTNYLTTEQDIDELVELLGNS